MTPNLYKIYSQGYSFENHYTPRYSCTTGESEYIALTSLVPFNNICTPNAYLRNNYEESLPALFKKAGYDCYSFHNWNDEFYDRNTLHLSMGFDQYRDIDALDIDLIWGWQSDFELIKQAFSYFKDSDKFFSFIITSSMHWPYDENSTLGTRYLEEINAVHGDYPMEIKRYLSKSMEFDKGIGELLKMLEEEGKADNTVICLFSDHHPFKLSTSTIEKYSLLRNRKELYGNDLTPFIIYNPNLEPTVFSEVNSSFDQVPTIANLFGLNYDSRLYAGSDIFNDDCAVIYPNADWITNEGIYQISKNIFTSFNDEDVSDAYISKINNRVQNSINVTQAMMKSDYLAKRSYLCDPKMLENN